MIVFLSFGACGVLFGLALVHIYRAAGGHWGKGAVIPENNGCPLFVPGPLSTAAVAIALLIAAFLLALRAGFIANQIPKALLTFLCLLLACGLVLRAIGEFRFVGFFKKVRDSRFAYLDNVFYSPLCLLLGLAIALVVSELGQPVKPLEEKGSATRDFCG